MPYKNPDDRRRYDREYHAKRRRNDPGYRESKRLQSAKWNQVYREQRTEDKAVWQLMIERGRFCTVFEIAGELDLTSEEVIAAIERLQER